MSSNYRRGPNRTLEMGGSPWGEGPYSRTRASIEGAGRAGPGETPGGGGARPHRLGPGTQDSLPGSPTRASLRSRIGQITETRGLSSQSGPGKTAGWARGRGRAAAVGGLGAGRGGEKSRSLRSERPWEDCGTPNPTPPQKGLPETSPPICTQTHAQHRPAWPVKKRGLHMRNAKIVTQARGADARAKSPPLEGASISD